MKRRIIDTLLLGVITVSTITLGSCQEITTSEKNIERKSQQGSIEKVIETTKYQSEKTLWDFLELTGILAVPFVIFIVGLLFKQIENKKNRNNLAEEAIQAYVDHMSDLLLNKECKKKLFPNVNDKLNPSGYDNPVRDVARTQTITILRRLEEDKEHQEIILNFYVMPSFMNLFLKIPICQN